jgi:hypothetical protein
MFPGFFSHNASEGHYFTRPDLYNRDRELFKKYVPLCKLLSEAGWEPITRTHADDPGIVLERFGEKHLTVLNPDDAQKTVKVKFEQPVPKMCRELLSQMDIEVQDGVATISMLPGDVAVLELM